MCPNMNKSKGIHRLCYFVPCVIILFNTHYKKNPYAKGSKEGTNPFLNFYAQLFVWSFSVYNPKLTD